MMEYSNLADMFDRLNRNGCEYVVLRNYSNLLDSIYMDGHDDVDILCRDVKTVVNAIGAETCRPQYGVMGDNVHFYIRYKDEKVSIDVRSVGDGYYCEEWGDAILRTRVPYKCFYVMNEENHVYSLIYHAVFQKPGLSNEYQQLLSGMLGKELQTESQLIDILEAYMGQHGYRYVYCKDFHVPLRHCMHDRSLCSYTWRDRWPHLKFEICVKLIALLVKMKHTICRW